MEDKVTQNFELNISIEPEVLKTLKDLNMKLCLMRSFRDPLSTKPYPTIWMASTDYSAKNTIIWERESGYSLYVSKSLEGPPQRYKMKFGQTFNITDSEGHAEMDPKLPTANDGVFIINTSMENFFVGLEQEFTFNNVKYLPVPISSQKIRAESNVIICPGTEVYVTFAASFVVPGQTFDPSSVWGILVEMRNGEDKLVARHIQYKRSSDGKSQEWETFPRPRDYWSNDIPKEQSIFSYLVQEDALVKLVQEKIERDKLPPEQIDYSQCLPSRLVINGPDGSSKIFSCPPWRLKTESKEPDEIFKESE